MIRIWRLSSFLTSVKAFRALLSRPAPKCAAARLAHAIAASREFADATEFESLLEEHLRALLSKRLTKPGAIETPATITWHQGSPWDPEKSLPDNNS